MQVWSHFENLAGLYPTTKILSRRFLVVNYEMIDMENQAYLRIPMDTSHHST